MCRIECLAFPMIREHLGRLWNSKTKLSLKKLLIVLIIDSDYDPMGIISNLFGTDPDL